MSVAPLHRIGARQVRAPTSLSHTYEPQRFSGQLYSEQVLRLLIAVVLRSVSGLVGLAGSISHIVRRHVRWPGTVCAFDVQNNSEHRGAAAPRSFQLYRPRRGACESCVSKQLRRQEECRAGTQATLPFRDHFIFYLPGGAICRLPDPSPLSYPLGRGCAAATPGNKYIHFNFKSDGSHANVHLKMSPADARACFDDGEKSGSNAGEF